MTGEVAGQHSRDKQVLAEFAAAVSDRDALYLDHYVNQAAAGTTLQQLNAMRMVAGVTDADAFRLHELAAKRVQAAQTSRYVTDTCAL